MLQTHQKYLQVLVITYMITHLYGDDGMKSVSLCGTEKNLSCLIVNWLLDERLMVSRG